ncbi:MAG: RDD family protein [Bacillota bacterium]|nr:RDD family protein [Bacillota bacterium]
MVDNINQEFQYKYIGFWKRVLAILIDIIFLIPIAILYLKTYKYFVSHKMIAPVLIYYILIYAYHIFFITKYGGTPGKLLTKIKIVNKNCENLSIKQVLLRYSPQILGTLIFLIMNFYNLNSEQNKVLKLINSLIGYFTMADVLVIVFDNKKRAIHDYIAGSFVISKKL